MRHLPPVTLAIAALLALPGTAAATTTVTRAGNAISISGDDGPNLISVGGSGNFILYQETSGTSIVAGDGCVQERQSLVSCGESGPGLTATVVLGGGDDTYDDRIARTDWPADDVDAGDGNDTVEGSYGNDLLRGGAGDDTLGGIAGNDQIDGGPGADTIQGGADDDTIVGGPGRDSLYGDGDYSGTALGGNDTIGARDGEVDQITCGWGADTAQVDAADLEDVDCENVDRPASPPSKLTVRLTRPTSVGLQGLARGRALPVIANISQPCTGSLTLTVSAGDARRAGLGRSKVTLGRLAGAAPAGTVRLSLKAKPAYRSRLRHLKRLKATLSIACRDASGSTARHAIGLTLTRQGTRPG